MAPPRRRDRDVQLAFEAITIEGGLLSPEWLARVAQLKADGQSEADYRIDKGLNLRDEIGRYWRIAQAHWADLAAGRAASADPGLLAERFVPALLEKAFGFVTLARTEPVELEGRSYPLGRVALGGRIPVVIAPAGFGLDRPDPAFGDGVRRRSAFGLAQEYLNAADDVMWGIATDGLALRLLRDNASLTRPAWIEADLERIFTEGRYADFAALWLLLHESRFGKPATPASECALEAWRAAGREEGTRAREQLRNGVEQALLALGTGFLAHPANGALRDALHAGTLTTQAYFQELLRLVYRLIFLLTAEERGVLHAPDAGEAALTLYAEGYALRVLRDRALKRSAHDRFSDLWEGVKVVLRGVATGEPRLGLPALGGLFAAHQCPHLDAARLENRALLAAVFKLSWLREDGGLTRVNWRDMGPEELGSVYESLLELVPRVTGGRTFEFATGGDAKGNARKTTGSYYTPESLVQVLLDSALDPVIQQTIAAHPPPAREGSPNGFARPEPVEGRAEDGGPADAAEALLRLSVVDPACGSGHFLLAAARRIADQVAKLRAEGTPSPAEYRHALREVVRRCLYGVDLNPMAVELCRVALWMEAVEPGRPLTFLDSHIQQGNSLLGTTPELMAKGIPDAAFEPIEGDDKKTASFLKKRNKAAAEGQRGMETLWNRTPEMESAEVTKAVAALDAAPDESLTDLAAKEARWEEFRRSPAYRHQKLVADAWCAAFVWPKPPTDPNKLEPVVAAAPTNDLWRQLRDGQGTAPDLTVKTVEELAKQYQFLHWHLAFPQVFARGGFDVVVGNPPWERVKLQEQEFFASRDQEIANAPNAAARKKLISSLPEGDPQLWAEWCAASRLAGGESHFIRGSSRYVLCGKGDVNTYAIFAEHNRSIVACGGRAGFIVPPGLATDDTTKAYLQEVVAEEGLVALYEFENEEFLFPHIDHRVRFILITVVRGGAGRRGADLCFANRGVASLADRARHFSLSRSDFRVLNPNTQTCPTFRSRRDADINLAIYGREGVLWREGDTDDCNRWGVRFMAMFHMANDSSMFRARDELTPSVDYLPLLEAKMVRHFDHRFGTYEGQSESQENQGKLPELDDAAHADPMRFAQPYYWVEAREVASRLAGVWSRKWLLGWRRICRSTDQRTFVPAILPLAAVGDSEFLILPTASASLVACAYANLASFVFDYTARQKIGGTNASYHIVRQLPVLAPNTYECGAAWAKRALAYEWLIPNVLELTYTAWDLEPFAKDVGYDGPPFRWDPARRFLLRCELDAAFFHLYGISRDDTDYIMETFPIVRKNDEKAHGEYRTKRVILEIYDEMAEAIRTGRPYKTRLDPPPADPRVAHPPREPPRKQRKRG